MKILHIIPSYEPAWNFGGTVTATSNLCRTLVRKGVDVTVYTTNADGTKKGLDIPVNEQINLGGVKVWYFPCDFFTKKAFYSKELIRKLESTIKEFDLIHLSVIWQWIGFKAYEICKKSKIPYILTPHSSLMKFAFYSVGNKFVKRGYWNLFAKKIMKNANAIHFLCEGEREESREFCDNSESFIVPNGIKIGKFNKDFQKRGYIRAKLGIPSGSLIFLFLGRIHPKKRIELVLKSMPAILKKRRNVYFVIVGPVEEKNYSKKLKDLANSMNISKNLRWIGPVENRNVLSFYSAADVMVLPSVIEGVSMAVTEAMAMSLPVVISNRVANYKEVELDDAGVIVEPVLSSVRKALLDLCVHNRELFKEKAINARKSVEKRYDMDKVAGLMIKVYEDVLTNKRTDDLLWR